MDVETKYQECYEKIKRVLSVERVDYDEVKMTAGSILSLHRSFPEDLRFRIWEVLLDVSDRTEPDFELIISTQARFSNDHVLTLDVERSFNMIDEPQKSTLRKQLTMIISTYCAKYDVAYWQGMHDMVSVLLLMDPQPPLERIFILFSMFLQTFLPYVFDDRDCLFLKHLFEMIRLLLLYHDPQLALHLQQHSIIPAIYSPSWLLTLFSHDISQSLLLTIWDQYIFYKNPSIHVFTILSHLISNKARILAYPTSELLELMTHLPFENDEVTHIFEDREEEIIRIEKQNQCNTLIVTDIVKEGIRLMHRTPPGFVHRLSDLLNDRVTVSQESLDVYSQTVCVVATPVEIFTFLLKGIEKNTNCLHYLILDTRSYASFRRRHLTQSKNVTKLTLLNLEKMDLLIRKSRSREYHIVILENGIELRTEGDVCGYLTEMLQRRGCKYISHMSGGFDRIWKCIEMDESVSIADLVTEEKGQIQQGEEDHWEKPIDEVSIEPVDDGEQVETISKVSSIIASVPASATSPTEVTQDQSKGETIKIVDGKQLLRYDSWLSNPLVYSCVCKKVTKTAKDGKETFVSSAEKKMVLTTAFMFILDVGNCPEIDYAVIDSRYKYSSIETLKEAGKEYIYMVIAPNKDGQKKKLLYYVASRNECLGELRRRIE